MITESLGEDVLASLNISPDQEIADFANTLVGNDCRYFSNVDEEDAKALHEFRIVAICSLDQSYEDFETELASRKSTTAALGRKYDDELRRLIAMKEAKQAVLRFRRQIDFPGRQQQSYQG